MKKRARKSKRKFEMVRVSTFQEWAGSSVLSLCHILKDKNVDEVTKQKEHFLCYEINLNYY